MFEVTTTNKAAQTILDDGTILTPCKTIGNISLAYSEAHAMSEQYGVEFEVTDLMTGLSETVKATK